MVEATARSEPQVLFVSGRSGTGKTTLLKNLDFPRSFLRVTTMAQEMHMSSYSLLRSFVEKCCSGKGSVRNAADIPEEHLALFLSDKKPDPAEGPEVYFSSFRKILGSITESQELVWIVEDLHMADYGSLQVLENLLGLREKWPFLCIATYQTGTPYSEDPIRKLRAGLRRKPGFHEIRLQPFTEEQLEQYLENKYDAHPLTEVTRTLFAHTEGLPLFVNELTDHLWKLGLLFLNENGKLKLQQKEQLPIPESIRDLLFLQMADISDDARELLEIAASFNTEFDFGFLEKFTSSPACIDELIRSGMIVEKFPGTGSFRHTLFREMIMEGILWSRRKELCGRIAGELEKMNASPFLLADFWHRAGNVRKSRPALMKSVEYSCDVFAYRDAAYWADMALRDWAKGDHEDHRVWLLRKLALCSRAGGNADNAIKACRELLESPVTVKDKGGRAEIYRQLAELYGMKGAWNLYYHAKREALVLFRESGRNEDVVIEGMELAQNYIKELKYDESLAALEDARAYLPPGNRDLQARLLALKGYIDAISGDFTKGYREATDAVNMALKGTDLQAISESYRRLAGTLEYGSAFMDSVNAYEVALDFCETNQLDLEETQCLSCMAWVFLRTGEWRKCFETTRRVMDNPGSSRISKCTAASILALIRAYRGEMKTARKNLEETIQLATREASTLHHVIAAWPMSVLPMVEGNTEEATRQFTRMLDLWFNTGDRHDSLPGLNDAISFFTLQGSQKELSRCIGALTQITGLTYNQEATAALSFALGASLFLNGEPDGAREHLNKSLEIYSQMNAPLQHAIVGFHQARVLRTLGEEKEAGLLFDSAYQRFRTLGIRFWCALIDAERAIPSGAAGDGNGEPEPNVRQFRLTRRQLEILELLTQGLSNKEIADSVHLSTRTVDMHVRNIFDRLNCRTRTEATRIALDHKVLG